MLTTVPAGSGIHTGCLGDLEGDAVAARDRVLGAEEAKFLRGPVDPTANGARSGQRPRGATVLPGPVRCLHKRPGMDLSAAQLTALSSSDLLLDDSGGSGAPSWDPHAEFDFEELDCDAAADFEIEVNLDDDDDDPWQDFEADLADEGAGWSRPLLSSFPTTDVTECVASLLVRCELLMTLRSDQLRSVCERARVARLGLADQLDSGVCIVVVSGRAPGMVIDLLWIPSELAIELVAENHAFGLHLAESTACTVSSAGELVGELASSSLREPVVAVLDGLQGASGLATRFAAAPMSTGLSMAM